MAYATTNPATGEVVARFDSIDNGALDRLIERANQTFERWRDMPVANRAAIVARAGDLMRERADEFARLITLEMGKSIVESRGEVKLASAILKYYGKNGPDFLQPEPLKVPGGEASVVQSRSAYCSASNRELPALSSRALRCTEPRRRQYDSCSSMRRLIRNAPLRWNASSSTPAHRRAHTRIFSSAAIKSRTSSSTISARRLINRSDAAGKSVAEIAGRSLKKVVLELGGSDPFIVLDADNLERTVKAAVMGRMANTGQSCVAAKRFIVLESCFDAIRDGMKAAFESSSPAIPPTMRRPSGRSLLHLPLTGCSNRSTMR